MFVHTLALFEWEKGTKKSSFSDSDLRILKKFNDSIQRAEKSDALTITYGKIYTYSFVGVIQIGTTRIEILPKLFDPERNQSLTTLSEKEREQLATTARKNLFSLLSFAGMIPYYKSGVNGGIKMPKCGRIKVYTSPHKNIEIYPGSECVNTPCFLRSLSR